MRKTPLFIWIPFLICAMIFLGIKIHSLGIRASDTNIYFYTAKELLAGKILYKDIFFTNFPLIPYAAVFYFIISGGSLLFYYLTASFETIITGSLIYYIVYNHSTSRLTAATTTCLYFFSFMILSTTDHQTGVFLASLFIMISYLCLIKKRFILIGVFTALALLTKAYSLPLLLSYFVFFLLTNRKHLLLFILGGTVTSVIIMLPSLIFAPAELMKDVFTYSLTRSQGIGKGEILYFLIQHDFLFLILLGFSIITINKNKLLGLFSLFSILFFILYKDVYYLYLNITLPLLCMSFPILVSLTRNKFSLNRFFIPTVVFSFCIYNLISYFAGYDTLQKLPLSAISRTLHQNNITLIYGVNGIATGVAFTNNLKLMNGIVDTNDNIFRKGYLNASQLTHDAVKQHAAIITQGAWYPDQGITEDVVTEIVDKKILSKNCYLLKRYPFQSEGIINSINLFSC